MKKAYPSSHSGSFPKEMTEHECSMPPRMINNEKKSLETPTNIKSSCLPFSFNLWIVHMCLKCFNQMLDAFFAPFSSMHFYS